MRNHKPSPGLVIACIALFVALSGTAVAAKLITGKQIKNGTITKADLASSAKPRTGPRGADGADGLPGPAGPAGPAGIPNVVSATVTGFVAPGGIDSVSANCPAGTHVLSGGYFTDSGYTFIDKTYGGTEWTVGVDNSDYSTQAEVDVTALCVAGGTTTRSAKVGDVEHDLSARRASK